MLNPEHLAASLETEDQGCNKRSKAANQYYYRHHYLSIIQEEEENSSDSSSGNSSCSSSSVYAKIRPNTDSIGMSMESVNSILSDESTFCYAKAARPEAKLSSLLENVPPPPLNEHEEVIEDNCKKLTCALEEQLQEIERQVSEKKQVSLLQDFSSKSSKLKVMLKKAVTPQKKNSNNSNIMGRLFKSKAKATIPEAIEDINPDPILRLDPHDQEKLEIAALIQECEDYVKTEEFTKDLSSQILKMFMQERSNYAASPQELDFLESSSRQSFYENGGKHEESPDSTDSAYDSDKKMDFIRPFANMMSKSSSLNQFEDDNVSVASTIKNAAANNFRDESISYDTIFSEYESAMSDIEETMSILSRRSRSTTPTSSLFVRNPDLSNSSDYGSLDRRLAAMRENVMTDRFAPPERSMSSLGDYSTKTRELNDNDRDVTPIALVFDELKDYLSESDLSLDYKIARSRSLKKKKLFTGSHRSWRVLQETGKSNQQVRSSSVPPPCSKRTDSSRGRVRQYSDKLLSIQGAKFSRATSSNEIALAPIPEERYSLIEKEQHEFDYLANIKSKNESLRSEFFKDLLPKNKDDPSEEMASGESRIDGSFHGSLKRKKEVVSASLNSLLPKRTPNAVQASVEPLNPLSRTPSRSRSGSPITFTSCVKVQYKPRIVPYQPLYGRNQFLEFTTTNDFPALARSQSASAMNSGVFFAQPYEEQPENPPPRPPLPLNYQIDCKNEERYFLSLPREWNGLSRSNSCSTMLH